MTNDHFINKSIVRRLKSILKKSRPRVDEISAETLYILGREC